MTTKPFEITQRDDIYQGFSSLCNLTLNIQKYDGSWMQGFSRELVERPEAAGVLLFDPIKEVCVMIEQFRIGAVNKVDSPWLLEVVAGIFDKDDEPAESLIRRESIEEANCTIIDAIPMCQYLASPGYTNELLHLYLGFVDSTDAGGVHGLEEEHEDIQVTNYSVDEMRALYEAGKINNGMTLISVQWLLLNYEKARAIGLEKVAA